MSEEKKGFTFTGLLSKGLSVAHRGIGNRPHKKAGTAIIGASAAYGYLVDPVGGIIGAVAGLGVRYPEKALAVAQYADSVVDALLGRKPEPQAHPVKDLAKVAEGYDDKAICEFAELACASRERRAAGKMQPNDEKIIAAAVSLGL